MINLSRLLSIVRRAVWVVACSLLVHVAVTGDARADMPASAKKVADSFTLSPELKAMWEAEHKVDDAWLAAARREGALEIKGSERPKDFDRLVQPFRERYPFIKLSYSQGSRSTRVVATLVAFRQGRHTSDLVTGIDTAIEMFRSADALADLSGIPNRANVPEKFAGNTKHWTGMRLRYYCLVYNSKLVKKSDLPKNWDELKSTAVLQNGKLALWYGVASWLLPLWGEKGPDWGKQFVKDLFETMKAEKRKEGMTSLTSLTAAGEFNGLLAAAEYQVQRLQKRGAPIGFHCLDTVMVTSSSVGMLKGSPHPNAAKLFLNWLLSLEGQLSQYHQTGAPPIHKALQTKEFIPFPDEIIGKRLAFRPAEQLGEDLKSLSAVWQPYWDGDGAAKGEAPKGGE